MGACCSTPEVNGDRPQQANAETDATGEHCRGGDRHRHTYIWQAAVLGAQLTIWWLDKGSRSKQHHNCC